MPKGHIEAGSNAVETAVREVAEETGLHCEPIRKLDPLRYVFQHEGELIAKSVTFFLMRPIGGQIGRIAKAMRGEVAEVRWLPLDTAPGLLAYRGEQALVVQIAAAVDDEAA